METQQLEILIGGVQISKQKDKTQRHREVQRLIRAEKRNLNERKEKLF